ncbi:MAG: hypothetical protein NkDv07_0089 [Candidatus Improbicoccus devescovinae]|nr:MAG: hypothetical protein NkDv07_0089 [Candidatus Improbicoccus devescovinae]
MIRIKYLKYFLVSFIITSLCLMLICGLVVADHNTRYIAFGDTRPIVEYNFSNRGKRFVKFMLMNNFYEFEF